MYVHLKTLLCFCIIKVSYVTILLDYGLILLQRCQYFYCFLFVLLYNDVISMNVQPHSPDNRALARECKDVKIDRVYIGSCTGCKTEDFIAAAKVFLAWVREASSLSSCSIVIYSQDYVLFSAFWHTLRYWLCIL